MTEERIAYLISKTLGLFTLIIGINSFVVTVTFVASFIVMPETHTVAQLLYALFPSLVFVLVFAKLWFGAAGIARRITR